MIGMFTDTWSSFSEIITPIESCTLAGHLSDMFTLGRELAQMVQHKPFDVPLLLLVSHIRERVLRQIAAARSQTLVSTCHLI